MNKENIIVAGIVALVVSVLSFVALPNETEVVKETTVVKEKLGALASPDVPSPYLSWGDGPIWRSKNTWNSASTTVCSFQAPADGKLLSITAGPTVATSSLNLILATSTTPNASTTLLTQRTIGGSARTYFTWSAASATTTVENQVNGIIRKDIWVNLSVTGPGVSSVAGVNVAGTCSYIFEQIN